MEQDNTSGKDEGFCFREHTADLVIEGWSKTKEGLFINLARGTLAAMGAEFEAGAESISRSFTISAPDPETLLVDWLTYVVTSATTDGLAPQRFELHFLDGGALSVEVQLSDVVITDEIKAVTYHEIEIQEEPCGYRGSVTFDL